MCMSRYSGIDKVAVSEKIFILHYILTSVEDMMQYITHMCYGNALMLHQFVHFNGKE